uniref:Putative glycerophosphocholine phosphodiesterase gpcpd1-like protein n=1 Tax=Tabanus bromius TaxID=304241 RepID=A0A0K8TR97_TABBR
MQRWWVVDDKAALDAMDISPSTSIRSRNMGDAVEGRQWTFKLVMNHDMLPNEMVAITGECQSLGSWAPAHCVIMNNEEGTNNWHAAVSIPRDREIAYRYFVGWVDPTTENVHVRRWETHLEPRVIPVLEDKSECCDIFGDVNGVEKIDLGFLTTETIVQFKFFNAPFSSKQRIKNRLIYVKITPMNLKIQFDQPVNMVASFEDSLSNDTKENGVETPPCAFAEVARLTHDESVIKTQPQFGTPCGPNDILIFHITVSDPESIAYLVDLYTYSSKAAEDEPPYHLGYHYILPNVLKRSEGKLELPITCATKHRPLGMMQIGYLLIKPSKSLHLNMKQSYLRYWNKKWTGLDVGHRGSGTSFKTKDNVIRENTIASLKNAAAHGADMVEFDVQLSKDLVPVIYHDFHVYVSLKSKKTLDSNDLLELPMRELTLEQLKNLKLYHLVEGRSREPRMFEGGDCDEHQPFPQLSEALDGIDPHIGFNIEIKSSQQLADGTMEAEQAFDRNLYVDCILDVVLRKGGNRRIVFSCFDPDTCAMLRFKQNLYPVMFLTLGSTERYPKYIDPRCNTIDSAVLYAKAIELLGIVAHTEDLLRDPTRINLAKNEGLIIFCWGDDNNSKETIKLLKNMGLHAIIYDKMDVNTPKEVKESVFLVQARESQNEFLKLQCLEMGRRRPDDIVYRDTSQKILELDNERERIGMSTATSFASLSENSE